MPPYEVGEQPADEEAPRFDGISLSNGTACRISGYYLLAHVVELVRRHLQRSRRMVAAVLHILLRAFPVRPEAIRKPLAED
eukprot:2195830-Rhodomonas_salina.1